jgi:hypothetical protein
MMMSLSWGVMASSEVMLNPNERIKIEISQDSYTRLSVEGEDIKSVYCLEGLDLEEHFEVGQLFISKVYDPVLHLTFITDTGYNQDAVLVPSKRGPQTIVLKKPEKKVNPLQTSVSREQEILKNALRALVSKKNLDGFMIIKEEVKPPFGDLEVTSQTISVGNVLKAHVYDVKNTTNKDITLDPNKLKENFKGALKAFYLSDTHFKPSSVGKIVILSLKEVL